MLRRRRRRQDGVRRLRVFGEAQAGPGRRVLDCGVEEVLHESRSAVPPPERELGEARESDAADARPSVFAGIRRRPKPVSSSRCSRSTSSTGSSPGTARPRARGAFYENRPRRASCRAPRAATRLPAAADAAAARFDVSRRRSRGGRPQPATSDQTPESIRVASRIRRYGCGPGDVQNTVLGISSLREIQTVEEACVEIFNNEHFVGTEQRGGATEVKTTKNSFSTKKELVVVNCRSSAGGRVHAYNRGRVEIWSAPSRRRREHDNAAKESSKAVFDSSRARPAQVQPRRPPAPRRRDHRVRLAHRLHRRASPASFPRRRGVDADRPSRGGAAAASRIV